MNKRELQEARGRLEAFLEPLLPLMGRLERRRWGAFYVQGLLLEGGRKTAAGMAERFGGNVQALQQFVSQSPWDWAAVRRVLASETVRLANGRPGWILDDTGFPKKGVDSVGVARQYSGTLGKVGNCQIGVSLNYATDQGCFPLDFRLYLPKEWTEDSLRRRKAGIPSNVTFKRKWELGIEMIDQARDWEVPVGVLVTDAGYGVSTEFRTELQARGLSYVVGITGEIHVWPSDVEISAPEYSVRGRRRQYPVELPPDNSVLELAKELPDESWFKVSWREGAKGPITGRFATVRVRPSNGPKRRRQILEPVQWLLVEWPVTAPEPTKFWLSNLPEDTSLTELIYWAKLRWWVEQNYQQLKDDLGLDHFEGRSWTGWHHHVTLTMIAFNFLVTEGFRSKKNFWVDPPTRQKGTATDSFDPTWFLPDLRGSC
jgi:SRSO17 transposase